MGSGQSDYKLVVEVKDAQDLLHENAAFLPEGIYSKYLKVYDLILNQYLAFGNKLDLFVAGKSSLEDLWDTQFEKDYQTLCLEMNSLSVALRDYLNTLTICE